MVKRIAMSIVGLVAILGLLLTGCGGGPPAPVGPEPVKLTMYIRNDLAPWPGAGHYIADQLEKCGFTMERIVRAGTEMSPIWTGPINTGSFHIVTGGWSSTAIPRDQGTIFEQMYTHRIMTYPVYTWLENLLKMPKWAQFNQSIYDLRYGGFSSMAQRESLFNYTLWKAQEYSNEIWILDLAGVWARRPVLNMAIDVAGGAGDPSWVHTAHFQVGGVPQAPTGTTVLDVENPNVFVEPWNPVEGSAYTWDMWGNRRCLGDAGVLFDPRSGATGGLAWNFRIANATVVAQTGLPIAKTLNYLTLSTAPAGDPSLTAPDDCWTDWNATSQSWITVAQRKAANPTFNASAKLKITVIYPPDVFSTPLHDGSTMSLADFLMADIMTYDRGKSASPIYEPSQVSLVAATVATTKGFRITSLSPLTYETYTDVWFLDAENSIVTHYPQYGTYGWTGFWHDVSVGWAAEAVGYGSTNTCRLSFSKTDAVTKNVSHMDYTKGTSLPILAQELAWCKATNFIPYQTAINTTYVALGAGDLAAEKTARWTAIDAFYTLRGHFWVGNGPYLIANAATDLDTTNKVIKLTRFASYNQSGGRWLFFCNVTYGGPNTGAWFDQVIISKEANHANTVAKMKAGTVDMFGDQITDPIIVADIKANLSWVLSYGSYRDMRINTYARSVNATSIVIPEFDDFDTRAEYVNYKLNPMAIDTVRQAINWAFDRAYIVGYFAHGMGSPKYTVLGTQFPDYARYFNTTVKFIEQQYAFNLTLANSTIYTAMMAIPGVTYNFTGGKWWYYYKSPYTNATA